MEITLPSRNRPAKGRFLIAKTNLQFFGGPWCDRKSREFKTRLRVFHGPGWPGATFDTTSQDKLRCESLLCAEGGWCARECGCGCTRVWWGGAGSVVPHAAFSSRTAAKIKHDSTNCEATSVRTRYYVRTRRGCQVSCETMTASRRAGQVQNNVREPQ